MDERDGGDLPTTNGLQHRQGQAPHRPPADDVGLESSESPLESHLVVTRHRRPRGQALCFEPAILEVPCEFAVHPLVTGVGDPCAAVGGENLHLMPLTAQMLDGGVPDELVSPVVVGGIAVAHRQDPHG